MGKKLFIESYDYIIADTEWATTGMYLVLGEHIVEDLIQACGGAEGFPEEVTFDAQSGRARIKYKSEKGRGIEL